MVFGLIGIMLLVLECVVGYVMVMEGVLDLLVYVIMLSFSVMLISVYLEEELGMFEKVLDYIVGMFECECCNEFVGRKIGEKVLWVVFGVGKRKEDGWIFERMKGVKRVWWCEKCEFEVEKMNSEELDMEVVVKCEDCGEVDIESVSSFVKVGEYVGLCEKCEGYLVCRSEGL